jgi:cytochrome c2
MKYKITLLFIFSIFSSLFVSCREVTDDPSIPVVFQPTPATTEMVMAGAAPIVEVIIVGDSAAGAEWFLSEGCNACHSTGADKLVGPGQQGVYERAATRPGYNTPEQYIASSIKYPGEYVVEGYSNLMPASWEEAEKQEIADIIAYLKTLK